MQRYEWIWRIYLLAISLAVAQLFVMFISGTNDETIFMTQEEQNDVIYLFLLGCIAYLWRPNPSQQMYAYATLMGDDGEMPSSMVVNKV